MKRRSKPKRHAAGRDQKDGLPTAERAELQRQGAKAAARGEERDVNPMDEQLNRPSATGECPDLWQRRKDAWQQGHGEQFQPGVDPGAHRTIREESDEH
jgi:hypothetical protein